jgi:hypothetical protein
LVRAGATQVLVVTGALTRASVVRLRPSCTRSGLQMWFSKSWRIAARANSRKTSDPDGEHAEGESKRRIKAFSDAGKRGSARRVRYQCPVFGIELQGSCGGRPGPFCKSSIE